MRTLVQIPGIHCQFCAVLIRDVSQEFPSIQNIDVNVDLKTVDLRHDGHFDLTSWTGAVEELNTSYTVKPLSQTL
ncbi:MAG: heavy-metal-associated domain-containing protein [Candidatus Peregrinibacteria bacterium]